MEMIIVNGNDYFKYFQIIALNLSQFINSNIFSLVFCRNLINRKKRINLLIYPLIIAWDSDH